MPDTVNILAMAIPSLICSDVDGTLIRDDQSLSDENKRYIRRAIDECGAKFMIVTGRMYSALYPYYKALGVEGIASCLNGSLLYERGKLIVNHKIDKAAALNAYLISLRHGVDMLSVSEDKWFTLNHSSYLYNAKLPIYNQDSGIVDFKTFLKANAMNKLLFMSDDQEAIAALRDDLMSNIKNVTYYYNRNFVEIMPYGVNKGTSIDDISKYLGIDKDNIMAIGDDYNDIEMLRKAGYSFAMGNAPDEVKSHAKFITDTNERDGVAKAIERVFFS